jgi:hypothetical protein
MRTHNSARPHTTSTRRVGHGSVTDDAPAGRPNLRRIADAVIAGYIHDISRDGRHNVRVRRAREARLRLGG